MSAEPMAGKFIVIEGIEGTGKTTLRQMLSNLLTEINTPHLVTREPGGTPLAEQLREIVLGSVGEQMDDTQRALLITAGRRDHVLKLIKPALERGDWVICDRFVYTMWALQRRAIGLTSLEYSGTVGITPDLIFYLEATNEQIAQRIANRQLRDTNYFDHVLDNEREEQRVEYEHLWAAPSLKHRVIRINTTKHNAQQVLAIAKMAILKLKA